MSFARGNVGRDAAWSLVYLSSIRLAGFALSVVIARLLGTAGAGSFGVAMQVATLGSLFAGMNLSAALARALPGSIVRDRKPLLRASLVVVGSGAVVVAGVLVVASSWLASGAYRDPTLGPVLAAAGALSFGTSLFVWSEGSLQGLRRFRWLAAWGAVVAVVDLLSGVLAAFSGLVTFLIARAILRVAAVAVALDRIRRWLDAPPEAVPDAGVPAAPASAPLTPARATRELLAFAGPSILSNLIVLAGWTALRLLLVRHAGLDEAGYYQVSDTLGQGLAIVPIAASLAYMPAVAEAHAGGRTDLGPSLGRALRRVTGFNLPLCCAVAASAPWIVSIFFGSEFVPAIPTMVLLAANAALIGVASVFGATVLGRGEVWTAVGFGVMIVVVALAAYEGGLAARGAAGAALALILAHSTMLVAYALVARRRWGVSVRVFSSVLVATFLLPVLALASLARFAGSSVVVPVAIVVLGIVVFARWGLPELRHGSLRVGAAS